MSTQKTLFSGSFVLDSYITSFLLEPFRKPFISIESFIKLFAFNERRRVNRFHVFIIRYLIKREFFRIIELKNSECPGYFFKTKI
jgi:hypothetical protein